MLSISRSSDSKFLDSIIDQEIEKQSFCFDRISLETTKKDPFEDREIDSNIWQIKGDKLLKKTKVNGEKK